MFRWLESLFARRRFHSWEYDRVINARRIEVAAERGEYLMLLPVVFRCSRCGLRTEHVMFDVGSYDLMIGRRGCPGRRPRPSIPRDLEQQVL